MAKKLLKMLGILATSVVVSEYASANMESYPNVLFTAKNCETQRISIGGLVTANYQWVDVDDDTYGPQTVLDPNFTFGKHNDPDNFSNFYMKNIRLFVRADLCDGWAAFMGIDFAGRDGITYRWNPDRGAEGAALIDSSNECRDRLPIFVDRAYIEAKWCATIFRAGYQKVYFGAEQLIPDERIKTVNRSIATNYFMSLGRRAVAGAYQPGRRSVLFGGNAFADRHVGLYLEDNGCTNFHYSIAVVNGYQGLCRNSTQFNNELGYFAGASYESCMCDTDFKIGFYAGYKPDGGNWTQDPIAPCDQDFVGGSGSHTAVWAFNPYVLGNWNCFTLLAELFVGGVENSQMTDSDKQAHPWGVNLIPSYMLNDCWELVGRLSYLNTNKMGTSIENAFGAAPNHGTTQNPNPQPGGGRNTYISSEPQFSKATALYFGINYYTVNQAVKLTLGYEWARFKSMFQGQESTKIDPSCNREPFLTGRFVHNHVTVQAVRAQVQLVF